MRNQTTLGAAAALATVLLLSACGNNMEQRAASGALIGAGTGAVLGGSVGSAVVGGVVGAGAGAVVNEMKKKDGPRH